MKREHGPVKLRIRLHPRHRFHVDVFIDATDAEMYRRVRHMYSDRKIKNDYAALCISLSISRRAVKSKSKTPLRIGTLHFSNESICNGHIAHESAHAATFALEFFGRCVCELNHDSDVQGLMAWLVGRISQKIAEAYEASPFYAIPAK